MYWMTGGIELPETFDTRVGDSPSENTVEVWWFWSVDCESCRKHVSFIKSLSEHEDVRVVALEIKNNERNKSLRNRLARIHSLERAGAYPVPLTVVGENAWVGRRSNDEIREFVERCLKDGCVSPRMTLTK